MSVEIYRLPEVKAAVGLSRATIYRWMKAGKFPAAVKLGGATGWRSEDIKRWIANLPAVKPRREGEATGVV